MASWKAIYKTLSPADQLTWINAAAISNYNNLFGQPTAMTGFKLFSTTNQIRQYGSLSTLSTFPTQITPALINIATYTFSTVGSNTITLYIWNPLAYSSDFIFYFKPLYNQIQLHKGLTFKYAGTFSIVSSQDITVQLINNYIALYGSFINHDYISEIIVVPVDFTTGTISRAFKYSCKLS